MGKKPLQIISLIFIFGFLIRFVGLGSIPRGFTPDEASQAYTAYSLLKTGRDEWGISWPVSSFKSFLDYKSPLQTYLMIPSIALFGLNEFAARLPSALFGSLAIISAYFLARKLTGSFQIGLITSFVLATSPWAIQFSRMALEANLAVFFITSGVYFFLLANKKPFFLYLSSMFFSLSLYTYHASKLFIPLFLLGIFIIFRQKIFSSLKVYFIGFLIGLVLTLPLIVNLTAEDSKRGTDLLITNFSTEKLNQLNSSIYYSDLYKINKNLPRLFHNKFTLIINEFGTNYLSYFSTHFWFLEGGREITYSVIPGRGLVFLFYLPFLVIGLVGVYKSSMAAKYKKLLYLWFLLSPLPAALTKEGYRPNRAIPFMFLLEFFISFGVWNFLVSNMKQFFVKSTILFFVFGLSFTFYLEDYIFGSHVNFPEAMSFGWRQAVQNINAIQSDYQAILIEQGGQPQSMFAFYEQIPPGLFQANSKNWQEVISQKPDVSYLDQLGDYSLEKLRFKALSWPEDIKTNTLYLAKKTAVLPQSRRTIKTITTPQGKVLFEIFDFPTP